MPEWKLFLLTSIFLTSVISLPIIEKVKSQLSQQGFENDIVSSENFQRSLTCVKCRTSLPSALDRVLGHLRDTQGWKVINVRPLGQSVKATMLFLYDGLVSLINIKMRYLPGAVQA